MAVSMAVIPLLKDDLARSFFRSLEKSKLKPYTDEEKDQVAREIQRIIKEETRK